MQNGDVYRRVRACVAGVMFVVACARSTPPKSPAIDDLYALTFEKIADGVYVARRPEPLRPYVEGNVTIIINERDVVVVDAGGAPQAARNVIAEIKRLTPNPVRYVIETHIHKDHRFGAQEYVKAYPGVEIVAHPGVHEIVTTTAAPYMTKLLARTDGPQRETEEELARARQDGKAKVAALLERFLRHDLAVIRREYHAVETVPPTLTVDNHLVLQRGARTIDVRFLGAGDTPQDLVVYLPREKIVCSGDMVVHAFPYGYSDQPAEWQRTLDALAQLDFDVLVPGHGEVQRGKAYLARVIELLRSVREQLTAAKAAGLDLAGARGKLDLSAFALPDDEVVRYYFQKYFVEPHTERVWKSL